MSQPLEPKHSQTLRQREALGFFFTLSESFSHIISLIIFMISEYTNGVLLAVSLVKWLYRSLRQNKQKREFGISLEKHETTLITAITGPALQNSYFTENPKYHEPIYGSYGKALSVELFFLPARQRTWWESTSRRAVPDHLLPCSAHASSCTMPSGPVGFSPQMNCLCPGKGPEFSPKTKAHFISPAFLLHFCGCLWVAVVKSKWLIERWGAVSIIFLTNGLTFLNSDAKYFEVSGFFSGNFMLLSAWFALGLVVF